MASTPTIGEASPFQPIILYIIQIMLICLLTHIMSKLLKYLKQPLVIAEMVAGIILGPSVLGHIPGFTETIFPLWSQRVMEVNADIGLMLYIFMVGTQIDLSLLESFTSNSIATRRGGNAGGGGGTGGGAPPPRLERVPSNSSLPETLTFSSVASHFFRIDVRRWRAMIGVPALIATVGVVVPLCCGVGLSWGMYKYHKYRGEDVAFAPFALFIGVAISMSALAVLARMLTERRMLHQPVGTLALMTSSVGVLETWIIMGLATSFTEIDWDPIGIFWSILIAVSDLILLLAVLKPILRYIVRRVEKEQEMSVTNFFYLIAIALGYATICESSGLSSSLGAMLVGMALPRSNGGQISRQALSERLEDLTSLFFLPLFFTLSGIHTNFQRLDLWDWGICVLLFAVAFVSKAGSVAIVARMFNLLSVRESICYGVLMQSKGLLALIIFNDALSADMISKEMFSILVAYVLLSCVITLPLVDWIYPVQNYFKSALESDSSRASHTTLIVASHPRQVRAMVSIVTALVKPVSQRERDQPPDRVVTAKLLKDTTRFSAPFTSLSLRKENVQKSYIRRDNVMSAARKRFSDLNVANGPLRLDQQLYVTANVNVDLKEIAQANSSDLIMISGPESSAIPTNNVGLPTVSLDEAELLEFSCSQSPCDTAIYYDKGPLLHPHVGKVLCAVVLGLERESFTALRLCARMRPKVEVEVLHIVAPGIGDNLELLNNMIAICTQKSMSYRVVINSNPMAALFEELNSNYPDQDNILSSREMPEDYYINPNNPYSNRFDKRPYSMIVVGALPPHLSQFLISNTTCAVLMVYPKSIPASKSGTETPPNSPEESPSDVDLPIQPSSSPPVSLMSIVAGASAPQVIQPEFPVRGSPHVSSVISASPAATSPPVRGASSSAILSALPVLSPPLSSSLPLSETPPFSEWTSPASPTPSHVITGDHLSANGDGEMEEEEFGIALLARNNAHQSLHSSAESPVMSPFRSNPPSQPSSASSSPKLSSRARIITPSSQSNVIIPTKSIFPNSISNNNNFPSDPTHSFPPLPPTLSPPNFSLPHYPLPNGPNYSHILPNNLPNHVVPSIPKPEILHPKKEEVGPGPSAKRSSGGLDPDYAPANPFLDPLSPFGSPDQSMRPLLSPPTKQTLPPTHPLPLSPTHTLPPTAMSHAIFPAPQAQPFPPLSNSGTLIPSPPLAAQQPETPLKYSNPFAVDSGAPIFPGSTPAELTTHFDFTVPIKKSAAQLFSELPLDVWSQICTHLNLAEVAALTRVCPALHRAMAHNSVWCAIATSCWPEAQSNATAGINWKQLCLLYHSKIFPHLVLRDYTGSARGRYHLVSCMFIGDDSEMGGAESVFFLNKISKGAAVTRATLKANVMTLEYAPYYFLTVSLSQLNKVQIPYDRSSAIVVPILTRSSQNTNIDAVLPKRYIAELTAVLQEAGPTSPLVVFFHFNTVSNTNSNSGDSTFVQKLVGVFHGLILKSPHPFRKLLVQPFNFRSGGGFSDGLWWMVSNIQQPPALLREEVLQSVTRL